MFSIRKKHKVQIYFNKEFIIGTNFIDSFRAPNHIDTLKTETKISIEKILEITTRGSIMGQIDTYFPKRRTTKTLNVFFKNHIHVYTDLVRIFHKHRKNDSQNGWYIPDEFHDQILSAFLIRNRQENIGIKIESMFQTLIKQKDFIEFTSKEKSILDIGSHDFYASIKNNGELNRKRTQKTLAKLIGKGLIENIEGCNESNIAQHFPHTKDRIFHYLNTIYGIDTSALQWVQNIIQLSDELTKLFESNTGNNRKKAWKVVQAFHAWGDILEIEERYAKTKERMNKIPEKFKKIGIDIKNVNHKEIRGVDIYTGICSWKGKDIIVSWRAKTPKSILKKLWETEEYVRGSAIRDELGISFTYPDDMGQDDITDLMIQSSGFLSENGYILKNKGVLNDEENFNKVKNNSNKKPLTTSHKPGGNPKMNNASQSGFTSLGTGKNKEAIGCEIQYSSVSAMKWKKRDDAIYKFRGAIDALMRGANQASPKEIFDMLTREIDEESICELENPDTGGNLELKSYHDIFFYLINEGIIMPYYGKKIQDNKNESEKIILLCTTKTHKNTFEKKWNLSELKKENISTYTKMTEYIKGLTQTH